MLMNLITQKQKFLKFLRGWSHLKKNQYKDNLENNCNFQTELISLF